MKIKIQIDEKESRNKNNKKSKKKNETKTQVQQNVSFKCFLRAALNDATVLSAWMSGGKSFHRMRDLGRKAFNARDDLTVKWC